MNYANLLARGLLILYCTFLLLFAFREGVLETGYNHAILAFLILILMIVFHGKPVISFMAFFLLFVFSVWFFKTYSDVVYFFIISAPLMAVSVLFLVGKKGISNQHKAHT